jgi:hypothetical protein
MSDTNTESKVDGRTKAARDARNSDRPQQHISVTAERETLHEAAHKPPRTRERTRGSSVAENPFHIPPEIIPPDQSWEWKKFSVHGMEDPFYLNEMRHQGWEPVDPRLYPEIVPPGYTQPNIIRQGLILMERPIELTNEAIAERELMARRQVNEAEERLGRTPRELSSKDLVNDSKIKAKVHREWNRPIAIED